MPVERVVIHLATHRRDLGDHHRLRHFDIGCRYRSEATKGLAGCRVVSGFVVVSHARGACRRITHRREREHGLGSYLVEAAVNSEGFWSDGEPFA